MGEARIKELQRIEFGLLARGAVIEQKLAAGIWLTKPRLGWWVTLPGYDLPFISQSKAVALTTAHNALMKVKAPEPLPPDAATRSTTAP